jgi:hypothetical protein
MTKMKKKSLIVQEKTNKKSRDQEKKCILNNDINFFKNP